MLVEVVKLQLPEILVLVAVVHLLSLLHLHPAVKNY